MCGLCWVCVQSGARVVFTLADGSTASIEADELQGGPKQVKAKLIGGTTRHATRQPRRLGVPYPLSLESVRARASPSLLAMSPPARGVVCGVQR